MFVKKITEQNILRKVMCICYQVDCNFDIHLCLASSANVCGIVIYVD